MKCYYWDEHIVANIVALRHKYAFLFLCRFIEMKGVFDELGEMNIKLNTNNRMIKKIPYRMYLHYKE